VLMRFLTGTMIGRFSGPHGGLGVPDGLTPRALRNRGSIVSYVWLF